MRLTVSIVLCLSSSICQLAESTRGVNISPEEGRALQSAARFRLPTEASLPAPVPAKAQDEFFLTHQGGLRRRPKYGHRKGLENLEDADAITLAEGQAGSSAFKSKSAARSIWQGCAPLGNMLGLLSRRKYHKLKGLENLEGADASTLAERNAGSNAFEVKAAASSSGSAEASSTANPAAGTKGGLCQDLRGGVNNFSGGTSVESESTLLRGQKRWENELNYPFKWLNLETEADDLKAFRKIITENSQINHALGPYSRAPFTFISNEALETLTGNFLIGSDHERVAVLAVFFHLFKDHRDEPSVRRYFWKLRQHLQPHDEKNFQYAHSEYSVF
ncbi:hypothetical protein PTTG_28750 [Puccinia triticina 1-1 BBBD Race 1]|uniref:Uncharacterized protein n=1 Tax=Puccinia triticina (isolate 1-1 / race 1 (BBBD)) TaxID=630390 RepID=A0A180G948_PUCT1|nr:hypothetical protein PTTG_28750 [Puccinia triticina 1-1 BBBD Race 1]